MQETCPVCQFRGHYDAEPATTDARVVCARCSSEYEVVLVDGQHVTALHAASAPVATVAAPLFARPQAVAPAEESVLDDVFSVMPEDETDFFASQSPVLEDVFAPSSVASAQRVEPLSAQVETPAEESCAASSSAEVVVDAEEIQAAPSEVVTAKQAESFDGYVAGARVMRASPLWLLACGLVFVGCIVLFNRITSEAGGGVEAASAQSVVRNDSTNQSEPSAFAPDVEIESRPADAFAPAPTRESAAQVVQPAAAQERVEAVKETAAPAERETAAVAQTAREAAAAAPASGGKYTVQVGAHNVSEKAEAQAARLKAAGFEARVVAAEVPNRGTWYRVQAGRFETREAATRHGAEMRGKGAAQTVVIAEIQ